MKHRNLSLVNLLLVAILLFSACGNDQTSTTSPGASTPAASTSPEAVEPTEAAGNTVPSVTPAVLTPQPTPQPTPDADGTPTVTPNALVPTETGMAAPTESGTLQPASSAVSEAGEATLAPSENKTPTKGVNKPTSTPTKGEKKPTSTPKPNSGKKLLYAVSDAKVQDAPNYYTSKCLGNLTHGKQYEVLEAIKGKTMTWYRISFNGKKGYVETKYLAAQQCSPTPTPKYGPTFSYDKPTVNLCPEMLDMINGARSELGLRPYEWGDNELEEIARNRAVDLIEEYAAGKVHAGTVNYWHQGLNSNIGEIAAVGFLAYMPITAFETWKASPGHWASIIDDASEDRISECDLIWYDGHKVKAGDLIPGEDTYTVCAYAEYEGMYYWTCVFIGKQRPWPTNP